MYIIIIPQQLELVLLKLSYDKSKKSKISGPRTRFLRNHGTSSCDKYELFCLDLCTGIRIQACVPRNR